MLGYGGYDNRGLGFGGYRRPVVPPPTPESLKSQIEDLEWQLKGRLSEVEQQLAELREMCGMATPHGGDPRGIYSGKGNDRGGVAGGLWLMDEPSKQYDLGFEPGVWQEDTGGHVTINDLEERDGHVFEGSVWDCGVFVGLDCMGPVVSLSLALIILLNVFVQAAFCYLIYFFMLDDPVGEDTLSGLLRFRTSVAHSALYADQVSQQSLANQVCAMDVGLHWANAQVEFVKNVRDASEVGVIMCLLATACWLATMLQEVMDTLHFLRALAKRRGRRTVMLQEGEDLVLNSISHHRFFLVLVLVGIPRLLIAVFLTPTGISYLRYTLSPTELVLNAMALTFIIQIDEMFYEAFTPRRMKCVLRQLKPIPMGSFSMRHSGGLFSTLRLFILVAVLAGTYVFMLQPFYSRVKWAEEILCSGETDFIYSVHPGTGIVQATKSMAADFEGGLSETQQRVLELAHPNLSAWNKTIGRMASSRTIQVFMFPDPAAFRNKSQHYDSHAFSRIAATASDDIMEGSRTLACEDVDRISARIDVHVAGPRIKAATDGKSQSCTDVNTLCSHMSRNHLRALCPVTCGCSNIQDPPAGFFASPAWGCPMKCYTRLKASRGLYSGFLCSDALPEEFATNPSIKNYIKGFFEYFLSLMESGGVSISMVVEVWDMREHLKIPLSKVNETSEMILNGTFVSNTQKGIWQFTPGVPHPRGLTGCQFWTSWEVVIIFGTNLCNVDSFRSLRMFCPESCKCKAEDEECPDTCPPR